MHIVYNPSMKTKLSEQHVREALESVYKQRMVYSILSGDRKPSYEAMYELWEKHSIPFQVWRNITDHIEKEEETEKAS